MTDRPLVPRMLDMYWQAKSAYRSVSAWRLSADLHERLLRVQPERGWTIAGIAVFIDTTLPPNSVVLE